jgi:hypothetical protein
LSQQVEAAFGMFQPLERGVFACSFQKKNPPFLSRGGREQGSPLQNESRSFRFTVKERRGGVTMRRVVMIFFIFVMVISIFGCQKETEQDKVRKVVTDIEAAAEEKDAGKIMDNLSKTYSDPQGSNYETIRKMLQGYFLIYPKISAYITNLDTSIENASAKAVFHVVLTSANKTGSVTDVVPRSLGMYDFNVSLRKESDGWKVTSAKWAQMEVD